SSEMGQNATDEAYAALAESLANRFAIDRGYNQGSINTDTFLGGPEASHYYAGFRPGPTRNIEEHYAAIDDNEAYRNRLYNIIAQVAAGSDVANLPIDNSSAGVARNAVLDPAKGQSTTWYYPDGINEY